MDGRISSQSSGNIFFTVLLLGMLIISSSAVLSNSLSSSKRGRSSGQSILEKGLTGTTENLRYQLGAIADSVEVLSVKAGKLQERRKVQALAAEQRARVDAAGDNMGTHVRSTGKEVDHLINHARSQAKEKKSDLAEKIKSIPTPKVNVGGNGGIRGPGLNYAAEQQRIAAKFDNEYPSEPVSDRPGPAYVPAPDKWADEDLTLEQENTKRKETVVDALKHSWEGYVQYAWGKDELQPRSKTAKNWNEARPEGMGLTILDAMTTMHLMGLEEELEKALEWVKEELTFNIEVEASAFESTIRGLGGLLSIYELRGEKDKEILNKAIDLADRLLWVFNTSTGLPHGSMNLKSKRHFNQQWAGGGSILSEFGTMQLEFRTLSYHTKNPVYDMKVTHAMAIILSKAPKDMLCPTYMSSMHLRWMTDHISIGALGDSFYEYLLKQYLLTGKTEERYKDAYLRAAHAIMDKLVFYSKPSKWAYIAEYRRRDFKHKMDHLACFAAGMLGFGAHHADPEHKEHTMKIAKELTKTCTLMYTRQKSGVSPEYVEFPGGTDFINGPGYYILRPEAMEAVFYMWRLTKDQHWRDVGWKMFAAINRWCRVEDGYAGLKEVNVKKPINDNLQQSFWFAETLKYSFLLFADDSTLNLDEWVLNTEGHPLKIRKRDPMDIWRAYEEEHDSVAWYPPPSPGVTFIETERMSTDRGNGKVKKPPRDPKGEEFEDGAVDDEGGPFDMVHGMKGIKRPGLSHGGYGDGVQGAKPAKGKESSEDEALSAASTRKPRRKSPAEEPDEEEVEETPSPGRHRSKEFPTAAPRVTEADEILHPKRGLKQNAADSPEVEDEDEDVEAKKRRRAKLAREIEERRKNRAAQDDD